MTFRSIILSMPRYFSSLIKVRAEMIDEKGLAPEAADKIGGIVQWRGGTTTGPTIFEMSNTVCCV